MKRKQTPTPPPAPAQVEQLAAAAPVELITPAVKWDGNALNRDFRPALALMGEKGAAHVEYLSADRHRDARDRVGAEISPTPLIHVYRHHVTHRRIRISVNGGTLRTFDERHREIPQAEAVASLIR